MIYSRIQEDEAIPLERGILRPISLHPLSDPRQNRISGLIDAPTCRIGSVWTRTDRDQAGIGIPIIGHNHEFRYSRNRCIIQTTPSDQAPPHPIDGCIGKFEWIESPSEYLILQGNFMPYIRSIRNFLDGRTDWLRL